MLIWSDQNILALKIFMDSVCVIPGNGLLWKMLLGEAFQTRNLISRPSLLKVLGGKNEKYAWMQSSWDFKNRSRLNGSKHFGCTRVKFASGRVKIGSGIGTKLPNWIWAQLAQFFRWPTATTAKGRPTSQFFFLLVQFSHEQHWYQFLKQTPHQFLSH